MESVIAGGAAIDAMPEPAAVIPRAMAFLSLNHLSIRTDEGIMPAIEYATPDKAAAAQ